ncbi:alkaline phosphatase D family protein [Sphingomonadaceae bacterium jetA1]|jgi:alkaline phosphatase D|uniref:alkaline phosphatase D family protein n=1 Tax=Facivitalis istanbulensis TaxID=3075838 RepID=UPI00349053CF
MLDRRALIGGTAALAAWRFLHPGPAVAGGRRTATTDPFALGVASGDPTADGFVLWTRLADATGDQAVGFEVADDDRFRGIVRHGRCLARAGRAHAVHIEVAGLPPGRPFYYRFHHAGMVSRTGRTITAPVTADRLRLALTSCQHWEQGWFTAYRDMIAHAPDLVLQVGDYIYEKSFGSGPDVRRFGTADPVTLDDYRARHALYRTDPDLQAAHAALPFVVTWDDHEVENDYAGLQGVQTTDPRAFAARRAAAYQAYFEHMPLRRASVANLYRRLRWGDLATLHILDTRRYRTPQPCGHGGHVIDGCAALEAPGATMLGTAQTRWLSDGLRTETAPWSLIVQQTLFARLHLADGPGARWSDIWDGYPASRRQALAALQAPEVRNALILGGDVHSFWLNDIVRNPERGDGPIVASEIVTSCLASRNGPAALFGPAKRLNPQVRFLDNDHAGYVLVDLDRSRAMVDCRAVDDLADPASPTRSLARGIVADRRPGFVS